MHSHLEIKDPIIPLDRYSSYSPLVYVTSWVMRFANLKRTCTLCLPLKSPLTVEEVSAAETYWFSVSQAQCFNSELKSIKSNDGLPSSSPLLPLHPFVDSKGLLGVCGRKRKSNLAYTAMHPVILSGKRLLTRLTIQAEHLRLLHARPTLLTSSQISHRWWSEINPFNNPIMHHLSPQIPEAKTSTVGTATG